MLVLNAMVSLFAAGSDTTAFAGCWVLANMTFQLFEGFWTENRKARSLVFLSGSRPILGGALLQARPLLGLSEHTMLPVAYFLMAGRGKIIMACNR